MTYKIKKSKVKEKKESYSIKKDDEVIVDGKKYTLEDMRDWFMERRKGGFPQVLYFGKGKGAVAGEGQSGGRYVVDRVHEVENAFVEKLGEEEYTKRMDKLMGNKK